MDEVKDGAMELGRFMITSGYGDGIGRPFVRITLEEKGIDFAIDATHAQMFAMQVLQAAVTAQADGLIVNFFRENLEAPDHIVFAAIQSFREYQESQSQTVQAA